MCNYNMSTDNLKELRNVFHGLQTLYQAYFPKVDPILIHDLLVREEEKSERAPFYMVEIFTKEGTNSDAMKNLIFEVTGEYTGSVGGWGASHEPGEHKH